LREDVDYDVLRAYVFRCSDRRISSDLHIHLSQLYECSVGSISSSRDAIYLFHSLFTIFTVFDDLVCLSTFGRLDKHVLLGPLLCIEPEGFLDVFSQFVLRCSSRPDFSSNTAFDCVIEYLAFLECNPKFYCGISTKNLYLILSEFKSEFSWVFVTARDLLSTLLAMCSDMNRINKSTLSYIPRLYCIRDFSGWLLNGLGFAKPVMFCHNQIVIDLLETIFDDVNSFLSLLPYDIFLYIIRLVIVGFDECIFQFYPDVQFEMEASLSHGNYYSETFRRVLQLNTVGSDVLAYGYPTSLSSIRLSHQSGYLGNHLPNEVVQVGFRSPRWEGYSQPLRLLRRIN